MLFCRCEMSSTLSPPGACKVERGVHTVRQRQRGSERAAGSRDGPQPLSGPQWRIAIGGRPRAQYAIAKIRAGEPRGARGRAPAVGQGGGRGPGRRGARGESPARVAVVEAARTETGHTGADGRSSTSRSSARRLASDSLSSLLYTLIFDFLISHISHQFAGVHLTFQAYT